MTTSLYSLRSTPSSGEFSIMKFDEDYAVESVYALNATTCTCPQGHKPKCKHRRMLPLFQAAGHVDDGWFLDWTTRLWRKPIDSDDDITRDGGDAEGLADYALMGDAEHAEEIARRLAPALETEGSALLGAPSTKGEGATALAPGEAVKAWAKDLAEREARTLATPPTPASAAMGVDGPAKIFLNQGEWDRAIAAGEDMTFCELLKPIPAPAPGELKRRRF